MKTRLCSLCSSLAFGFFLMLGMGMLFSSCKDDLLEDSYPSWLGSSIYGELESRGNFNYTLRLINDLNYADVLRKTGSRTVFVANDDAWNRFFQGGNNPWNVTRYEDLSWAQKRWIMNSAMINAPYLGERLSTTTGDNSGMAMRRSNFTNVRDSIMVYAGAERQELPSNSYWDKINQQDTVRLGYLDSDAPPMVHFVNDFRNNKQMLNSDMSFIMGDSYDPNYEIYLFSDPVVEQDVTCQNGYIHVLRDFLLPPSNMAEEMAKMSECSLFSSFLDRFTMPVYAYSENGKSVFRKGYFSRNGDVNHAITADSSGVTQSQLLYDPSWQRNTFATGVSFQEDMSTIFVPTNEALDAWWNSAIGKLIMTGYDRWEDVPNSLLCDLVNNHMKTSFLGSLPSIFGKVLNDGNREQGIDKSHVVGSHLANNGVIYLVNKVYTPDSYISVMGPCMNPNVGNLQVMRWAVLNTDKTKYIPDGYGTYLKSMESSFSFVIPTDDALQDYVDPFYVASDGSYQRIEFYVENNTAKATATIVDKDGTPSGKITTVATAKVSALLKDILDNCIIVMDKKDWTKGGYYKTKSGSYLNVSAFQKGATVISGGNVERNEKPEVITFYNQSDQILNGEQGTDGNGVAMAVNTALQPTLNSVSELLKNYSEFDEFRELLAGSDEVLEAYFRETTSKYQDSLKLYQALYLPKSGTAESAPPTSRDFKVSFLGNYNYTLYVPTNEAMKEAYRQGLPRWEDLDNLPKPDDDGTWASEEEKKESIAQRKRISKEILNFLRFHFQDNSLYTDVSLSSGGNNYKTQTFNESESVFYELNVKNSSNSLTVSSISSTSQEVLSKANVLPTICNKTAREYLFNAGVGVSPTATGITSSSYLVLHAVDSPLFYSKMVNGKREQFK